MRRLEILKLSFKRQVILGLLLMAVSFICATVFKRGILYNIGWVLYGLLFLLHPVFPENVQTDKKHYHMLRAVGALIIIIGITTHFDI